MMVRAAAAGCPSRVGGRGRARTRARGRSGNEARRVRTPRRAWGRRTPDDRPIRDLLARVVAGRRHGGTRPDGGARAGRDGLRGGRRPPRDRGPLRLDRGPRRVLPRRAFADPGLRAGLLAPAARRGGGGAARRRGSRPFDRPGCGPLDHGRGHVPGRGARPPRLRHRPALAADPGRLHERDRPHHPRRPAPEAPGVLGGRERRRRGHHGARARHRGREDGPDRAAHRARLPRRHPRAATDRSPAPRRPRGRRRRGPGGRRLRPLVRPEGGRGGAPGPAGRRAPGGLVVRPGGPVPRGARDRPHLVRRHERHLPLLRRATRRARGRGPRAGRPGRRERGGRAGRRVRLERERHPHARRRAGRLPHAGHRARRRWGDPRAAGRRARTPGAGAHRGPGRRRDLRRPGPLRRRGPAAALAPAAIGARPRPRGLPGGDALRRPAGNRGGRRPLAAQLHPACLASPRCRPRPRHQLQGLPRHRAAPGGATRAGPGPLPLGRAPLLRQRRPVPRARPGRRRPRAPAGALAGGRVRADDRHRHDRRRHARGAGHRAGPPRRGAPLRRAEGPREGPAAGLRDLRAARGGPLPPDDRERGQGLPRQHIPTSPGGTGRTSSRTGPRPRPRPPPHPGPATGGIRQSGAPRQPDEPRQPGEPGGPGAGPPAGEG